MSLEQENAEHIKIMNGELGEVRDRLTTLEVNGKWLIWAIKGLYGLSTLGFTVLILLKIFG